MNERADWRQVSKSHPCEICGKPDYCTYNANVARCMRIESDRPSSGGWIHKLAGAELREPVKLPPRKPRQTDQQLHEIWLARLKLRTLIFGRREMVDVLSGQLGVTTDSLIALNVGYDIDEKTWWMPERNHEGLTIGVNRRFADGKKMCAIGSRRGLTYCDNWLDYPGPIIVVEGASDTAAALSMNLCVIGRPSNTGGAEYLAKLIRKAERKRLVIVAGENDWREPTGKCAEGHPKECNGCQRCWPGLYGMRIVADELQKRVPNKVTCGMPAQAKDVRAFLNGHLLDRDRPRLWRAAGQRLINRLLTNCHEH